MAEALAAAVAPGGAGEAAIPTLASSREPVPAGTGRHDAWSTGAVTAPRQRTSPAAFFAGLALAPILVITAGGLWWWRSHGHAASEVVPLSSASSAATATSTPTATSAPTASATSTASAASATPAASASAAPARPRVPRGPYRKPESDRIGL